MITHRTRLRRRTLDTYVRVDRQEREGVADDRHGASRPRPARPRAAAGSDGPLAVTKSGAARGCDADLLRRYLPAG
jgi:hypothetical protein